MFENTSLLAINSLSFSFNHDFLDEKNLIPYDCTTA